MGTSYNRRIGQIGLLIVLIALWGMTAGCSSGRRAPAPMTGPALVITPPAGAAPSTDIATAERPTSTAAATAVVGARPAATDGARVRPRSNSINIRRGPGTQFEIAGLLRQDETALVLGRDAASTWFNIITDAGLAGWVAANVVEFEAGAADALDVVTTRSAVPAATSAAATATAAPPPVEDDEPPQPPGSTITATATANPALTSTPNPNAPPWSSPTPVEPYPPPTETPDASYPYPPPTAPPTPNPYP
ncbi:MAG: hypothetical protein KJ046_12590 [Anaerolineae bacterium]|nr:hypothetical protein [Anaerolineae bacterium]